MQNKNEIPDMQKAAQETLARARAAREEARAEAAVRELAQRTAKNRRLTFLKALFLRSCMLYLLFCILHFLTYLTIVYPKSGKAFFDMLLGGVSVKGHAIFYLAALITAGVYSALLYRQPPRTYNTFFRYISRTSVWYTGLQLLTIALYGLYLDMLYNPYAITEAMLLRGPSFLLSFSCLGFAFCINLANKILKLSRLQAVVRIVLHLFIVLLLSVVFFYLIASGFSRASDLLVFLVLFSALYIVCTVVGHLMRGAQQKDENEEQDYDNLYMTDELRRQRAEQEAHDEKKKKERQEKFRRPG